MDYAVCARDFHKRSDLDLTSDRDSVGYPLFFPRDLLRVESDRLKTKANSQCHPAATSGFLIASFVRLLKFPKCFRGHEIPNLTVWLYLINKHVRGDPFRH